VDPWTSTGKRTLVVCQDERLTKTWAGKPVFPDLQQALAGAQPGDVIRVVAGSSESPNEPAVLAAKLTLDGAKLPKNLVIEGFHAAGGPIEWRPPPGHPDKEPLLTLSGVQGLTVRGFRFEGKVLKDKGQTHLHHLVTVTGHCPGLKMEDLHFRGFQSMGVEIRDCTGDREDAITFSRLRFAATSLLTVEAGMHIETSPNKSASEMLVTDCRFEGPCTAAVRFQGPIATVHFRRNRFYKVETALSCPRPTPDGNMRLNVLNNTFLEVDAALRLEGLAPGEPGKQANRVSLKNNLFFKTAALLEVSEAGTDLARAKAMFVGLAGNVRDRDSGQQGVNFSEVKSKDFESLAFDPEDDRTFLRYPVDSSLNRSGQNGEPVGVPPAST
jgi:hypothetical protein